MPAGTADMTAGEILLRLVASALIGGFIGYERRIAHKAIGVAGMMLVAVGSATYMMIAKHEAINDPAAISRSLQGVLQGIGFLGGAVIFKGGTNVRGIKTAAAIWIAGALGIAMATAFWWLGVIVGIATVLILFAADVFPTGFRRQEEKLDTADRAYGKANPDG